MLTEIKPGARFRSSVCDVEVIVIKSTSPQVDLRCGGRAMLPVGTERPADQVAEGGFTDGTMLGKRYTNESGDFEVLCTKAGASSLSIGEAILAVKEAKPLPSSD